MMENNHTPSENEAILEYEKPELPKCVNFKYKIISYGNPNDVVYIDKEDLPSFSDNFVPHYIVEEMGEAQVEEQTEPNETEADAQDRRVVWNDKATKLLLTLYKQRQPLLRSGKLKSRKKMWEGISSRFAKAGYSYSAVQVENRFKTLLRAWRNAKQSKPLVGRKRRIFEYQEELDKLLFKDVNLSGDSLEIPSDQDELVQSDDLKQDVALGDITSVSNSSLVESQDTRKKMEWSNEATKLLTSLYKKRRRLLGTKKFKSKKEMFEDIAVVMGKRGYSLSATQIENRFKTLLRSYRKKHDTTPPDQGELEETFLKDSEVVSEDDEAEIVQEEESNDAVEFEHVEPLGETTQLEGIFEVESEPAVKKVDWDDTSTKILLSLYKEKKPLVETKKIKSKREMWENISAVFDKCGYLFSPVQIDNRFKTILRSYKKFLQTGKRHPAFIYQEDLDAIFMEDDDMFSETLTNTERSILKREISERLGLPMDVYEVELEKSETEELSKRKNTRDEGALYEIRKALQECDRKAGNRHSEVIRLMKENNEIQLKRNDILEKYLQLQMKQ